jgi:hypothetical protein
MNKEGVIYVCVNSRSHLKECIHSVKSLKKCNPDIQVALYTNLRIKHDGLFNSIFGLDPGVHPLKEKVNSIRRSPFERTLYLDADTSVLQPIAGLFSILDTYDIAIANAPNIDYNHRPPVFHGFARENVFNTGVIALKKTEATAEFLEAWKCAFSVQDDSNSWPGHFGDQFYFNQVLERSPELASKIKLFQLDNRIYNAVRWLYLNLSDEDRKKVVIRHWHDLHLNKVQWKVKEYFVFLSRLSGLHWQ